MVNFEGSVMHPIVPQLNKCLNFLSPKIDLNFRHLSSCDTLEKSGKGHSSQFHELFLVM